MQKIPKKTALFSAILFLTIVVLQGLTRADTKCYTDATRNVAMLRQMYRLYSGHAEIKVNRERKKAISNQ